jgi:phosphatidate cytidylyltransferase
MGHDERAQGAHRRRRRGRRGQSGGARGVAFRGHYYLTWPLWWSGAILAGAAGARRRRAPGGRGLWRDLYRAGLHRPDLAAPLDAGLSWTLLLFVVTWFADIFAFVTGSIFKGPKLWPKFSPNKTWSGFFGGLVAASLGPSASTP